MAAVSLSGGFSMEEILSLLQSVNIDPETLLRTALVLAVGTLVLGFFGRFVFGIKSNFSHAVSSSIGILFVYAVAIVVYSACADFSKFIPPLPFVEFEGSSLHIFQFAGSHYTTICTQLLNMVILAFLANLLDSLLPRGKNIFTWLFIKCITVIGAIMLQLLVNWLLAKYLPEGLITYAPVILLGLLVLLLLVGALKLIVGALLSTVNPLIGAFYTFFFATLVGKALTRSVLTTAILTGLVFALGYVGCIVISIASAALIAYIPFLILLVFLWYVVNKVLL